MSLGINNNDENAHKTGTASRSTSHPHSDGYSILDICIQPYSELNMFITRHSKTTTSPGTLLLS